MGKKVDTRRQVELLEQSEADLKRRLAEARTAHHAHLGKIVANAGADRLSDAELAELSDLAVRHGVAAIVKAVQDDGAAKETRGEGAGRPAELKPSRGGAERAAPAGRH